MTNNDQEKGKTMSETVSAIVVTGITENEKKTAVKVLSAIKEQIGTSKQSNSDKARIMAKTLGLNAKATQSLIEEAKKTEKPYQVRSIIAHNTVQSAITIIETVRYE